MTDPADHWCALFGVTNPHPIATTDIAKLWRVTLTDGTDAVLKAYHDGNEQDEAVGLGLLDAWNGAGAARLLDRRPGAALMEDLPGPSLGDLSRGGDDRKAALALAETAQKLHATGVGPAGLTPLDKRLDALFTTRVDDESPPDLLPALRECQELAQDLLNSSSHNIALHGDLHHDNVLRGTRGWCAIDAKGVWGDPAYDMANAFRNPVGSDDLWRDPARAMALADTFANVLGLSQQRLMGWAAVHAMASILWSCDGPVRSHRDADLPAHFLRLWQSLR